TIAARAAAPAGSDGKPLAMSTATTDCNPTKAADGPSATRSPLTNAISVAATMDARSEWPASDPMKMETAMPTAAKTITAARVRYAPWNDPNPTDTAPTAPNALMLGCRRTRPATTGIATPTVQRSAAAPSNCDQSSRIVGPKICRSKDIRIYGFYKVPLGS